MKRRVQMSQVVRIEAATLCNALAEARWQLEIGEAVEAEFVTDVSDEELWHFSGYDAYYVIQNQGATKVVDAPFEEIFPWNENVG
jgi:hypothetical protein